jgi:hypothetical protein
MLQIRILLTVIVLTVTILLATVQAAPEKTNFVSEPELPSEMCRAHQRVASVTKWFCKYDRIRRDAEMPLSDKLLFCLLTAARSEKRSSGLAARMIERYTAALSALKELKPIPETKDLQDGYVLYFSTARQLFTDYLDAQKQGTITDQSVISEKKKLEEIDKANKKLDATLRTEYEISRYRHRGYL